MQITQYVKEHPWATGIIVIVGGFIFLMIFRGGSSDSSSGGGASRPSDAEVAANAQIAAAQIAADAQSAQAGAAVQAAQIGANVQLNSDNKAAEVAMRALEAQQALTSEQISSDERVRANALGTFSQFSKDKNKQANQLAVVQSVLGTQTPVQYAPGKYNAMGNSTWFPQAGNTAGGIISSIGGLASSLGSIFSDQRLKENIRFIGYDSKGLGVYEWNYKGSRRKYRGYIAQEVARSHPEAITVDPGTGYWKVNTLALASI